MTPRISRIRRRRGGRTLVETALVCNLMMVILLAVFEYGRLIMIKQLIDNAAWEGVRMAVVSTDTYPPTTTAQIVTAVNGYLGSQPSLSSLNIQVYQYNTSNPSNTSGDWSSTPFGSNIAIQITANYQPMVPSTFGILPSSVPLTSIAIMGSEAN